MDDEKISEDEAENRYTEMLDELFGEVDIAGLSYSTGRALKNLDPIAFRTGMLDWLDMEEIELED